MENVFLEPPGQLQEWEIKQKKTIQLMCYCRVFAKHSYSCTWKRAVFCSTRSRNIEAVRLQGHIHRIFPDALHQKKREDKLYENATVLDNSCVAQNMLYLKTQNGQVPQTDRFLTTFCIKRSLFFRHKGVPPRVMFSPMHFPYKMPTFRCRTGSYLVWIDT